MESQRNLQYSPSFYRMACLLFLPIPFKKKSYKNIAIKTPSHNSGEGLVLFFFSEYKLCIPTTIEGALEIIWSNILAAPAKPPRVSCPEPSPDGLLGISPRMEILPRLSWVTNPCWCSAFSTRHEIRRHT